MGSYIATVYDIADIKDKKLLCEIPIVAGFKSEAMDKAHEKAYKKFPKIQRLVEIRST